MSAAIQAVKRKKQIQKALFPDIGRVMDLDGPHLRGGWCVGPGRRNGGKSRDSPKRAQKRR